MQGMEGRAPSRPLPRIASWCVALAFAIAFPGPVSRGQDLPGPTQEVAASSVAISSSHRFVVSGMTLPENVTLAVAVEEAAAKVSGFVGLPLPFSRGQALQIAIRRDHALLRGRVLKAQGWVDRHLSQKLILTNIEQLDQEDTLEGLCWLLLTRYVAARQTFEQKTAWASRRTCTWPFATATARWC